MNKIQKKIVILALSASLIGCGTTQKTPKFVEPEKKIVLEDKKNIENLVEERDFIKYNLEELNEKYLKDKEDNQIPIYNFKVAQKKLQDKGKLDDLLIENTGKVKFVLDELIKDSNKICYLFFSIGERNYVSISTNEKLLENIRGYLSREMYFKGDVDVKGLPMEDSYFQAIGFKELDYATEINRVDLTYRDKTAKRIKDDVLKKVYGGGKFLFGVLRKVGGVGI